MLSAESPTSPHAAPVPSAPADLAASAPAMAAAAERISVAGTLLEASRLMTELLRFVTPELYQRTVRITRVVTGLVSELEVAQPWEFEVAARLSQIGCLALPPDTRAALATGAALSDDDERAVASHPLMARDLLTEVRRLDSVREMVCRQREPYTVAGMPAGNQRTCDRLTLGGQLLRVASDYDDLVARGSSAMDAVVSLERRPGEYSADILAALRRSVERVNVTTTAAA